MSPVKKDPAAHEALLYEHRPDGSVVCNLCAHRCTIRPGLRGICGVRENRGGTLVTLVAERIVSGGVDPIEKKPLFHFLPGSLAFSIATAGCNFHCLFCQNWAIAQSPRMRPGRIPGETTAPEDIVQAARRAGCASIAYTYTEPTIFMELAMETGRLAVEAGLRNIFVTNGYMTPEALALVAPVLHGANVDLKSFSDRYYRNVCGATLPPVLQTIAGMRERRCLGEHAVPRLLEARHPAPRLRGAPKSREPWSLPGLRHPHRRSLALSAPGRRNGLEASDALHESYRDGDSACAGRGAHCARRGHGSNGAAQGVHRPGAGDSG